MVLRTIRLLGGILKNQYIEGDRPRKGGWLGEFVDLRGSGGGEAWQEREGGIFEGGPAMIILSHLELLSMDLPKLN